MLIFEDTDGDGHFDKRTVFRRAESGQGIEVGFGGVFVGNATAFIPDKDGDDKPDGPPVYADGFGMEDTPETLNAFIWARMAGSMAATVSLLLVKSASQHAGRGQIPINAGIWRYHPRSRF